MKVVVPSNLGWLEDQLCQEEQLRLWDYIGKATRNAKPNLLGHITESLYLDDSDNWFFDNVLTRFIERYGRTFGNMGDNYPVSEPAPYKLESFWYNKQRQHEFNPFHNHYGVYSFVAWLNIPYDWREQYALTEANDGGSASNFEFMYTNILGQQTVHKYQLDHFSCGTMLFFPSQLMHGVHPFYESDGERISVSGNINLDTYSGVI